ncbi:replication protein RepA [Belnapia sp. F-4-1]|uniref:replication protein RepA n=1 Tax=Belnapia sp. F-4-1 TaxID=1545443 RepID=UPI0009DD355F|nr:replication protein RepA [Belnapia sp. F-4-1]
MTQITKPRSLAANVAAIPPDEHVLWYHAAFCQLALPLGVAEDTWHRAVGTAAVTIIPGPDGPAGPSGTYLRLLAMCICDAAVRSRDPVISLGPSAAVLASEIGIGTDQTTVDEISKQLARLASAKVMVSLNGGPELTLFDARSKPRTPKKDWRSSLRLNARFHSSLIESAIPLNRRIVRELANSPTALDAYAWIRHALTHVTAGQIASTTWQDLQDRFGEAEQDSSAFRSVFEEALRQVFAADLSIAVAVGDEGVSLRPVEAEVAEAAPNPTPQKDQTTAPVQSPRIESSDPPDRPPTAPDAENRAGREADPKPQAPPVVSHTATGTPTQSALGPVSLRPHLTGLNQVIWLRQANGDRDVVVGITPDARFHPDRLTVLALEPVVMQVIGGIPEREFERVSAWVMANRDLIDDVWEGNIASPEGIYRRVRKVPAVGWR